MIGTYDSNVAYGQNRLQVVWNRIIFPDASSIDLGAMLGQDAHGAAGFKQDVDNHYKRLVGFAVLSSVFSAGFQLSQSRRSSVLQTPSAGETAASAVGQEVSQLGSEITRKNLNVQPTIKAPIVERGGLTGEETRACGPGSTNRGSRRKAACPTVAGPAPGPW